MWTLRALLVPRHLVLGAEEQGLGRLELRQQRRLGGGRGADLRDILAQLQRRVRRHELLDGRARVRQVEDGLVHPAVARVAHGHAAEGLDGQLERAPLALLVRLRQVRRHVHGEALRHAGQLDVHALHRLKLRPASLARQTARL